MQRPMFAKQLFRALMCIILFIVLGRAPFVKRIPLPGAGQRPPVAPTPPPVQVLPQFYNADYRPAGFSHQRMHETESAQQLIWKHQNPADCSSASFLRWTPRLSGFGSVVHQIGAFLALALNRGQVLILPDRSLPWWGSEHCSRNGHECYFVPLTHCEPTANSTVHTVNDADVVNEMPDVFRSRVEVAGTAMPDTPDRQIKYWWRAQAAAYTLRMSEETAMYLRGRRLDLRSSDYSVVVRHGLKAKEMRLYPVQKFLAAVPKHATVFLVTGDGAVLRSFRTAFGTNLTVVDRPRNDEDIGRGPVALMDDVLELLISLEATHHVGTLGSNSCRLIDELRRVWSAPLPGSSTPYIEVGCDSAQCPVNTLNW